MIRINLLPPSARKSGEKLRLQIPLRKVGIFVFAFVVLYSGWILLACQIQGNAFKKLNAEWEKMKPEKSRLDKTETALRAFQNRTVVLKSLKTPESQWAPRLNLLSDSIVSHLWFVSLTYGPTFASEGYGPTAKKPDVAKPAKAAKKQPVQEMPAIILKGSAFVTAQREGSPISRYLQRLKQHLEFKSRFWGLDLKTVEHRQVQREEISDFVIVLYPTGR